MFYLDKGIDYEGLTIREWLPHARKICQGKNKILHDQQKNQEILFVSQRKLTF